MKTDLYTKAVLTVITIALIVLCIEKNIVHANAAEKPSPQEVVIVGVKTNQVLPVAIAIMRDGTYRFVDENLPLPVSGHR